MLAVDSCARCGEDLTDTACTGHQRRSLVDIVFEKVVRHADAEIKHCTRCHAETRARFPAEMSGPLQYGPGVKAYVVHLLIAQMLSLKRVAQSMHALIGQLLSEATLLGYVAQLHRSLAEWERHAIERLLASPAMHVDETSLRVDRKNHWIHVYSAGTLTVKCLHPKRGCEAIEAIGIIPRYGGVAVHDCWASYLSYTHCEHALCGAHLLRELTFIVDAHDYAWAKRMKRLLLHACHEVAKRDESPVGEHVSEDTERERVQGRTETLPHHPHPGRARASANPPAPKRPARPRRQVRRPQSVGADEEIRERRAALRQASRCRIHQQSGRTRPAHEQGQAESLRVLPHPKVRRSLLPNLQLSPVHGEPGIQSSGGHSNSSRRTRRR